MGIERQVITKPIEDIPIVSFITAHNNMVYLSGVTADPEHLGDIKDQTKQVLAYRSPLETSRHGQIQASQCAGVADRYGEFRRPQLGLE